MMYVSSVEARRVDGAYLLTDEPQQRHVLVDALAGPLRDGHQGSHSGIIISPLLLLTDTGTTTIIGGITRYPTGDNVCMHA